ncbi:MAG: hypothetical protein ACE5ER_11615, partial [Nitrospinaceae bacterium]
MGVFTSASFEAIEPMLDSSVRTVPVSSQEEPTVSFDGNMEQVCAWVKDGRRLIAAEGLKGSSRSLFLAHLWKTLRRPLAVIVADAAAGETLLGDLTYFLKQVGLKTSPQLFPDWELLPYEPLSPLSETSGERLHLLHGMMAGERPLLILPVESCMQC